MSLKKPPMRQTVITQYLSQKQGNKQVVNKQKQQKKLVLEQKPKIQHHKQSLNLTTTVIDKKQTVVLQIEGEDEQSLNINIDKAQRNIEQLRVNLQFYSNKLVSQPSGDTIDNIHKKWWGNYKLLQAHHGFIQWLFPNAFKSRFNPRSQPLTIQQAQLFRNSLSISKKYLNSYMMILQFYGMKLKSKRTGQLVRSRNPKYMQRYQQTLLTAFHNHMRITRILSSLVMVGYGRYAKQLSLFLRSQIHSNEGQMKSLKKFGVYERQWGQYQSYIQKDDNINVYLKQLDKKQKQITA